jgi:hypothetical protein
MAHNNRSQPSQPPAFPDHDLNTICTITKSLNIRNPYRKYPPYGVPCAEGPNTFHLALRREKWWQMLQEHAIKEDMMMEKLRVEDEKKEMQKQKDDQEAEAEVEQKKQRKDSLVVEEKDVGYADTKGAGAGDGGVAATSAICDSSEDEEAEVQREVKGKKKSVGMDKGKGLAHGHSVRKVKPVGRLRTHARKGSGTSCCGSKTSTS